MFYCYRTRTYKQIKRYNSRYNAQKPTEIAYWHRKVPLFCNAVHIKYQDNSKKDKA